MAGNLRTGYLCAVCSYFSHMPADAEHLVLMLIAQVLLYYHLTLLTTSECLYCLIKGFAVKGGVSAGAAQSLHAKSGSQASFEATWQLVSPGPVSASLDCSSFCLFMHLLKTSMKGIQLPASIWPDEVSRFAFRALLLCTNHMHRRLLSAEQLRKENSFLKERWQWPHGMYTDPMRHSVSLALHTADQGSCWTIPSSLQCSR